MNACLKSLRLGFCAGASLVLGACASYDGRGLAPGASAGEVRAALGEPATVWPEAGGASTLEYPRGPMGRETYMARIGPDGKLRAIDQVLTEENFARIVRGKTTMDEIRRMLGRPALDIYYPRLRERVWDYRYRSNANMPMVLHVSFDDAGIVTHVAQVLDPSRNPPI